jgi:hypothetical protein
VVNDVTNVDRNALDEKTFEGKGGLHRLPNPAQRDTSRHRLLTLLGQPATHDVSVDRSRCQHVHSDPVRTELARSAFAHPDHRRLSGGVGSRRVCGPYTRVADAVSAGDVGASGARPIVPVSRVKPSTVASW